MNFHDYMGQFMYMTKDPTLEVVQFFMDNLDAPHTKFKCVHVAGTNGKGSCVETLCSVLKSAGYTVGKFISPYLEKFNEYIQLNDKCITDDEVEYYLTILKPLVEEAKSKGWVVKYWEVLTAIAFMHFAKNKVDIAIVEVGIGGTWDCTNIVIPLVSLITKAHYDHMEVVGPTIEQIAINDAGIIKPGVPVVTNNFSTALKVIEKRARDLNSPLIRVMAKDAETSNLRLGQFMRVRYKMQSYELALRGRHQGVNLALCLEVLELLKTNNFNISDQAVKDGLANVVHRARFEVLSKKPFVIFDGAHNPDSVRVFMQMVNDYLPPKLKHKVFIVSILNRKDIGMIMQEFAKRMTRNSEIIFTNGTNGEFYTGHDLQRAYILHDSKQSVQNDRHDTLRFGHSKTKVMDFDDALKLTASKPLDETAFFIVGSFKTYAKAKEFLCQK